MQTSEFTHDRRRCLGVVGFVDAVVPRSGDEVKVREEEAVEVEGEAMEVEGGDAEAEVKSSWVCWILH